MKYFNLRTLAPPVLGLFILSLIFSAPFLSTLRTGQSADWYGLPAADVADDQLPALGFRDARGRRVRREDFRGRFVFLYFGYSRCQDSCPVWLGRLLELARNRGTDIHILFVSIDPHDDADFLRGYLADRRPIFTAIPAGQREIFRLADRLGYRFDRAAAGRTNLLRHADAVYLFDRRGRLRLFYPFRWIDPEKLSGDLDLLDRENPNEGSQPLGSPKRPLAAF